MTTVKFDDWFDNWYAGLTLRQRIGYELTWRWYRYVEFPAVRALGRLWERAGVYFGWLDE